MVNIPHLLLAAGNSIRMGRPKHLMTWGDKTLLEHQITTLLKTGQEVIVILGAYEERIIPNIEKLPIITFINKDWEKGMGDSIAYGIKMLNEKFPTVDGVLISLIDQPLVTKSHFIEMLNAFQPKNKQIIVSKSASGWEGVPVLFDSYYFNALQKLNGEEGARKILKRNRNRIKFIDGGDLLIDIDTPNDYNQLLNLKK